MEKLTVAEYAELHSISVQAVYKKISRLNTIEEDRNGRKQILIIIGEEDEVKPSSTSNSTDNSNSTYQKSENSTCNSTYAPSTSTPKVKPSSTSNSTPDIIEILQEQLKEKDKQIDRLQKAGEEKDRQLKEQFEKFTALLMRSQDLEAITHKMLLEHGDNEAEIIEPKEEYIQKKNKGLFSRLLRRTKKGE